MARKSCFTFNSALFSCLFTSSHLMCIFHCIINPLYCICCMKWDIHWSLKWIKLIISLQSNVLLESLESWQPCGFHLTRTIKTIVTIRAQGVDLASTFLRSQLNCASVLEQVWSTAAPPWLKTSGVPSGVWHQGPERVFLKSWGLQVGAFMATMNIRADWDLENSDAISCLAAFITLLRQYLRMFVGKS